MTYEKPQYNGKWRVYPVKQEAIQLFKAYRMLGYKNPKLVKVDNGFIATYED